MDIIETLDPSSFRQYRKQYQNTICGRNPIVLLLHTVQHLKEEEGKKWMLKFVKYAQSSKCKNKADSSVSYASAVLCLVDGEKNEEEEKQEKGKGGSGSNARGEKEEVEEKKNNNNSVKRKRENKDWMQTSGVNNIYEYVRNCVRNLCR